MNLIPMSVGIAAMVFGIALMYWHWTEWTAMVKTARTQLELRYAQNQFRRRAVIGSMMALTGSILVSLGWVQDARVFTASILLLFLLLGGILVLGILDLLNVIVRYRLGPAAHAARARLIDEYHRRKKESAASESPDSEDSSD